jgi:acyl-coenzyme A synthetase/AMP-(fatty) acid ligase
MGGFASALPSGELIYVERSADIEFRDMLPKSKVGKLLRREVRDGERRRISKDGDKAHGNQRT